MYYCYESGSGIPFLILFINRQLLDNILELIMNYTIVNFNLTLLYIIFTKNKCDYSTCFHLLILWESISEEMFAVDEDIAKMSGEYAAITVILDRSEKFTFPRGCSVLTSYCYPVELNWRYSGRILRNPYWADKLGKICILSLGRGLLGRNIRAKYLPVCEVEFIQF